MGLKRQHMRCVVVIPPVGVDFLILESSKHPASAGRHELSQKANPQYPLPLRDPSIQRLSLPLFEKGVYHAYLKKQRAYERYPSFLVLVFVRNFTRPLQSQDSVEIMEQHESRPSQEEARSPSERARPPGWMERALCHTTLLSRSLQR